jgi:hypothetical protein
METQTVFLAHATFVLFQDLPGFTNSMVIEDQEINRIISAGKHEAPPTPHPHAIHSHRNIASKKNSCDIEDADVDVSEPLYKGEILLKEYFTNEKYLSYIKTITIEKIRNQALGK